jgi:GH15 family glucan-1,4-alpha-glucosidase
METNRMRTDVRHYPLIDEHGVVGDLQTAALVCNDGTIDWFCCPRFDSPSIFASLLDQDKGGYFRVVPEGTQHVSKQLYFPDTAVLITRFLTPDGVGEVIDFMPVPASPEVTTDQHQIVRAIRVVRGEMRFVVECRPRFDYGRAQHQLKLINGIAFFENEHLPLALRSTEALEADGDDIRAHLELKAGDVVGLSLQSGAIEHDRVLSPEGVLAAYHETVAFWRAWLEASRYRGRWREAVGRSAMMLKLMTYAPTGAPVAALTTGLPEQVGGERNWDYRYTWIRDGSFSVHALLGLGYTKEAERFMKWLGDRIGEAAGDRSGPLKIMYRVDGGSDLGEETLGHLEGYRGSRPVRIGNGAADQLQLDIYGEALFGLYPARRAGIPPAHKGWVLMTNVLDWLCDNWDQPDEGIWETRGGRENFTYGRVMSWAAFDRAIRLALEYGRPADLNRWTAIRDQIYSEVMARGWNDARKAFVQHYRTDVLDASVLMMPLVGFINPRDPMWLATLDAMDEELVSDSLVYRYNPSASPDGLRGSEGTFSICTFWYVDAMARSGRLEEARLTFEKMLTYGSSLGLYAEEIGPTGEHLGNFPQAFTHLSLINAALSLDAELEHSG